MLRRIAASLGLLLLIVATGCKSHPATIIEPIEDINHETSGWGLRKLDPKDYPDMRMAWSDKANLERAVDKSIKFLNAPSAARFYPSTNPGDTITHDQILGTLYDIKGLLHQNMTPDAFQRNLLSRYDVYTSVGYNDKGDVWFTGYYTPIYQGSLTPTAEFKYPVYSRLPNIISDPITGEVKGTYPTRKELMASGELRGHELMYFRKPIEPFIIQVQGSAKVILQNGQTVYLGYAGTNGRTHTGLGTALVDEGKIDKKHLSLPAVLAYFDAHPDELDGYVSRDDRFVFLKVYGAEEWPAGSLGVQVTADRSLATDKSIFPRASLTFVQDVTPPADAWLISPPPPNASCSTRTPAAPSAPPDAPTCTWASAMPPVNKPAASSPAAISITSSSNPNWSTPPPSPAPNPSQSHAWPIPPLHRRPNATSKNPEPPQPPIPASPCPATAAETCSPEP